MSLVYVITHHCDGEFIPCVSVNYKDDDDDDLDVLGRAWVGWETIKELEHISIGRKTNISNTSNIHNLSQRRAVTLLLEAPTIWSISS